MSDRTIEWIRSDWKAFQKSIETIHGKPMTKTEALEIVDELLAEHRRGMMMSKIRSWIPCDFMNLATVIKEQAQASEKPEQKTKQPSSKNT